MNKFTIFTIILAVSVVTVTADLAVRDYFGAGNQASVLSVQKPAAQEAQPVQPDQPAAQSFQQTQTQTQPQTAQLAPTGNPIAPTAAGGPIAPESVQQYMPLPSSSTVTQELAGKAGLTGNFTEKHFDGKVYQLLDITKFPVEAISFYEIQQAGSPIASVTEIALKDEIRALQLYTLLQNKTKPYIDLSLNETNAYGDRSFYINHTKKPDEAFLTVKIGRMIYAFAYIKQFHPEIKKMIQLLMP